ncbi:MAG: TonB-dependent receptor [Nitrospirae bacterium CG_4_9_14_3_um_filter_51_5]|nr:MAG: TonB-dependent receptor [Nitrospirae bacterium CG_4_9_14_3_um_filter_51_5]
MRNVRQYFMLMFIFFEETYLMKTPNISFQRNVYSSYFSLVVLILTVSCFALPAFAAVEPNPSAAKEELLKRREALEGELQRLNTQLTDIQHQLKTLEKVDEIPDTLTRKTELQQREVQVLQEISVVGSRIHPEPIGITRSTTPRSQMDNQPAKDFRESLESQPGIILRRRNGPRDFSIAIRGFGAKQGFGVRKIKLFEDGFDLTQSDGLSRLDLNDPWFMESTVVERGASSALYGNFALGGMVDFRTRKGRDINGVETFTSVGSYGYQKYATAIGKEYDSLDAAVFVSHERGDGFQEHSEFDTTTVDANFRFNITDRQSFTLKAANNDLNTLSPQRLTPAQFDAKPKQAGTGAKENDRSRRDRRTIIGGRYTNQITPDTELSLTSVYDNKDINQLFGIRLEQIQPNFKNRADVRNVSHIFGRALRSHVGVFFDYLENETTNFRNLPDFKATKMNAINNQRGSIKNIGFRIREEWDLAPQWTIAAGVGYEWSQISIEQTNFNFISGAFASRANVNRNFTNVAPDFSVMFHPAEHSRFWGRVSGGYGIPDFGGLTTTPAGLPGANNALNDERNINLELGGQVRLHPRFAFQLVGFWNFFKDELISQTVVGGTGTFTTNADSSEYRGIEISAEWMPLDGVTITGAYTFVDATFINFTDTILVGGVGTPVNRDGNTVPAVEPHVLNLRTAYEHPSGWGGWAELTWTDDYYVNNANTLRAQSATIANLNVHYASPVDWGWVRLFKAYVQVENLFDQTFMSSAAIVSDSTPDANKQAFLLAQPLSVFGGITLGLF